MTSQSTYDIDLTEDELMLKYDIKRVLPTASTTSPSAILVWTMPCDRQ